ncbi:MAG TPA: hypothetical protein VN047_03860 [Sphingopyxis sp.]|nr:hypothetical protein [Sphingopyxis sp.]
MTVSFFMGTSLKDRVIAGGIIIIPLATLALLAAIFLRPEPIDQQAVWGCYVAVGAPALRVEANRIHILDGTHRSMSYVAEHQRRYLLTVQPALQLSPSTGGSYSFVNGRGTGYFWPLLAEASDDLRGVSSPQDFGGRLGLVAADGTTIVYVRSESDDACS